MYARIVTLLTISRIFIYIYYFSTHLPLFYSPCSFINLQLFEFDFINSIYNIHNIYKYYRKKFLYES